MVKSCEKAGFLLYFEVCKTDAVGESLRLRISCVCRLRAAEGGIEMKQFNLSGNDLFRLVPFPAVLVQKGKTVYFNPAAEQVFRMAASPLTPEGDCPGLLEALEEGESEGILAGERWQIRCHPIPEGRLFLLRQEERQEELLSPRELRSLSHQLRENLDGVFRAVEELERNLTETERLRMEQPIAQLEQRAHRLLCLCWDVSILEQMAEAEGLKVLYPLTLLDMAGLCRDVWRQADYLVERAGSSLIFQTDEDSGSALVAGHDYLLTLLVSHLLAKALSGSLTVPERIRLHVGKDQQQVFVTVERFRRRTDGAEPKRKRSRLAAELYAEAASPAGLVRSTCQRIVNYHGGALVEMEGKRSHRTILYLPLKRGNEKLEDPLRGMQVDYTGGFNPALVALSGQLPLSVFRKREDE